MGCVDRARHGLQPRGLGATGAPNLHSRHGAGKANLPRKL
ncbi:hypothetical protein [Azospirillum doebereinerae]